MTRAEVEEVPPDPIRAGGFLDQARRFLRDAEEAQHAESAVVLYWQACISAMDAVLAHTGQSVGRGEDAHRVRVEAAGAIVGGGYRDLFERLDEWRRERHGVSYAAPTPSAADVAAMQADARDVVAAAETYLEGA